MNMTENQLIEFLKKAWHAGRIRQLTYDYNQAQLDDICTNDIANLVNNFEATNDTN